MFEVYHLFFPFVSFTITSCVLFIVETIRGEEGLLTPKGRKYLLCIIEACFAVMVLLFILCVSEL